MTAAFLKEEDELPAEIQAFLELHPEWRDYIDLLMLPPSWDEIVEWFSDASGPLCDYEFRQTSYGVTALSLYAKLRRQGQSHKFAEMIALQCGPRLNTDDTFFAGFGRLYEQFGSQKHLDRYIQTAKKHGFTPSPDSVYMPSLARFQGDPEAFVTRSQGRHYIRKLLESRGYKCDSSLSNIEAREPEDDPLSLKAIKPLGEDIIRRRVTQMTTQDPSLKSKSRSELREMVIAKHGPQS
jgi:hypothetical protein